MRIAAKSRGDGVEVISIVTPNALIPVKNGARRLVASFLLALAGLCACTAGNVNSGWAVYGGHASGDRYSPLRQITPANVGNLKLAWRFDMNAPGESQTNPIVIGRTLYAYSPDLKIIALDAAKGTLRWRFDAGSRRGAACSFGTELSGPARGLAYWSDGKEGRLLAGVMHCLYALDSATGSPIASFGEDGAVDLRKGLPGDYRQYEASLTSPGIVYRNLIIVGFRTAENASAAPGDIRAYDIRTGHVAWDFHTIPRPGEAGYDTWPRDAWKIAGAANAWAGFALDEKRGIVYASTGSAAPDFYGAERAGDNLFANTLLALDAATGRRLWHFQGVHHDLWDRDFPSPPVLLSILRGGKRVDAVAQTSKQGFVFVFDRVTGAPLFPIAERPVSRSNVPGEIAAATQPFPTIPEPFARQRLTVDMLTTRTPAAHAWAVREFDTFISAGQFVPFSVARPTVVFPGFDGGAEWGGAAIDRRSGVIYINSNDVAWTGRLVRSTPEGGPAASLYQAQCSVCHGLDRKGSPPAFPSLLDIGARLTPGQVASVIRSGKGRMPSFANMASSAMEGLIGYLLTGREEPTESAPGANIKRELSDSFTSDDKPRKFRFAGYNKFLDPDGYPAVAPPWGTLSAIDLKTGKYLWKIPLGEYPELAAQGMKNTGTENYGGPIVTAGGVVFIGATVYDRKIRAFDSQTGALLWDADLPFAGTATPATYMVDGKQYVVIGTSSARNAKAPQGSAYVAFALTH